MFTYVLNFNLKLCNTVILSLIKVNIYRMIKARVTVRIIVFVKKRPRTLAYYRRT